MAVTCDMREGKSSDWYYTLIKDHQQFTPYGTHQTYVSQSVTTDLTGQYYCGGANTYTGAIKESNTVSLTVSGECRSRPRSSRGRCGCYSPGKTLKL